MVFSFTYQVYLSISLYSSNPESFNVFYCHEKVKFAKNLIITSYHNFVSLYLKPFAANISILKHLLSFSQCMHHEMRIVSAAARKCPEQDINGKTRRRMQSHGDLEDWCVSRVARKGKKGNGLHLTACSALYCHLGDGVS